MLSPAEDADDFGFATEYCSQRQTLNSADGIVNLTLTKTIHCPPPALSIGRIESPKT